MFQFEFRKLFIFISLLNSARCIVMQCVCGGLMICNRTTNTHNANSIYWWESEIGEKGQKRDHFRSKEPQSDYQTIFIINLWALHLIFFQTHPNTQHKLTFILCTINSFIIFFFFHDPYYVCGEWMKWNTKQIEMAEEERKQIQNTEKAMRYGKTGNSYLNMHFVHFRILRIFDELNYTTILMRMMIMNSNSTSKGNWIPFQHCIIAIHFGK